MIELTTVAELATQYTASHIDGAKFGLFIFTLMAGIMVPIFGLMATDDKLWLAGFFILVVPLVLLVQLNADQTKVHEDDKLTLEQLKIEYDDKIKKSPCEDVRLHIVDMLENEDKSNWYIEKKTDWVQDLYYHKCEVPLRAEVLKLQ